MIDPKRGAKRTPWIWPPVIIIGLSVGGWVASVLGAVLGVVVVVWVLATRHPGPD